jgi:predicted MFS family arabinose efflux permease
MALAVISGIASALFFPALAGLVPEIVPSDRLQSANGMLRLGANTARIGGPIVGGLIVTAASPVWGLAANAASFAISAMLVAGLSTRKLTPGPSLLADLRGGWQEFASRSWLWSVVLAGAVMNLAFNAGLVVLGPVIARAEYGGARAWSIVLTALAIGMVTGTLLAMRIRARRPLVVVALAFVPLSLPFALLAAHAKLPVVVVAAIIAGISLDVISVLWDTTIQRRVPMDAIGRVTSYDMVGSFALAPLGLILAGPAAVTIGVSASLVGCAVLIAGAGLAALLVPAVRYLHQPAG